MGTRPHEVKQAERCQQKLTTCPHEFLAWLLGTWGPTRLVAREPSDCRRHRLLEHPPCGCDSLSSFKLSSAHKLRMFLRTMLATARNVATMGCTTRTKSKRETITGSRTIEITPMRMKNISNCAKNAKSEPRAFKGEKPFCEFLVLLLSISCSDFECAQPSGACSDSNPYTNEFSATMSDGLKKYTNARKREGPSMTSQSFVMMECSIKSQAMSTVNIETWS
mmetsp:Transcript_46833/g.118658  ORF Transcript_46833/g.118658 Transcript_46833/m.118658 type:complete len:222 (+) Transcript_46833:209-874(+)